MSGGDFEFEGLLRQCEDENENEDEDEDEEDWVVARCSTGEAAVIIVRGW